MRSSRLAVVVMGTLITVTAFAWTLRPAVESNATHPTVVDVPHEAVAARVAHTLSAPGAMNPARQPVAVTEGSLAPMHVVHADNGGALAGVEVIEVPYNSEAILRTVSDADGCVWLPPATRNASVIGVRAGFCFATVERHADAPEHLVLALRPSRPLVGQVINVPGGLPAKYDLRVEYRPRYLDPQTQQVFDGSARAAVPVVDTFVIDRVDDRDAQLSLRAVDRGSGASITLRQLMVPAAQDEIVIDLGGRRFVDPLAEVTVRIRFLTPEPTGEFAVRLNNFQGGTSVDLRGERNATEDLVVLRQAGVPRGHYQAEVTAMGSVYRSDVVAVAQDAAIEMVVEQWDSLVVRLHGLPPAASPKDFAVRVDGRLATGFDAVLPARTTVRNLPPGRHVVRVSGPRLGAGPVDVDVVGRELAAVDLTLEALHRVRIGVFLPIPEAGNVRIERDGALAHEVGLAKGRRWVETWLPEGQYLVSAQFPTLREQRRLDLFGADAELRFER